MAKAFPQEVEQQSSDCHLPWYLLRMPEDGPKVAHGQFPPEHTAKSRT